MSNSAPTTLPEEIREALRVLAERQDLEPGAMRAAVARIMAGDVPEVGVSAFLTALRVKGETPEELTGAVRAVRDAMLPFEAGRDVLDTCGTGGDGANTVNVSTAAAIVVAACGVPVAKHGNRAATGNSGSSEVLLELGIPVEAESQRLRKSLHAVGITFLFAPKFHPALRYMAPVRRMLPFRTLFNLIGPLANPALPAYQLIGVAGDRQAGLMAGALASLGATRAAVVTGADGLDEVSLEGPTDVRWVESGEILHERWVPSDFGLEPVAKASLRVDGPADSARKILAMLEGESGPTRSFVLANAAAALLVAEKVDGLRDGTARATEAIDSGKARALLESWRKILA